MASRAQGERTDAKLCFWTIFQFFYPNETCTHPPTSIFFWIFEMFLTLQSPLVMSPTRPRQLARRRLAEAVSVVQYSSCYYHHSTAFRIKHHAAPRLVKTTEATLSYANTCVRSSRVSRNGHCCIAVVVCPQDST